MEELKECTFKDYMAKKEKCKKIINAASVACGGIGTGFAQLPLADSALITPIQIMMIINIAKEFDVQVTESMATAIIGSLSGAVAGRCISCVMFGWFPVVGNLVNTATAAGLTKAIGHLALEKFSGDFKLVDDKTTDAVENVEAA